MPQDDSFVEIHERLRNHLRCTNRRHTKDAFCWKARRFNKCVEVPTQLLFDWAKAIQENSATIHQPPDTPEFHDLEKTATGNRNQKFVNANDEH